RGQEKRVSALQRRARDKKKRSREYHKESYLTEKKNWQEGVAWERELAKQARAKENAEHKAQALRRKEESKLKIGNNLKASAQRSKARTNPKSRNIPEGTISEAISTAENPNDLADIRTNQMSNNQALEDQQIGRMIKGIEKDLKRSNKAISKAEGRQIKKGIAQGRIDKSSTRAEARTNKLKKIHTSTGSKKVGSSGSLSGSLFGSSKDSLVSLDIETSGLDRKKDFIWSVGTATASGEKEHFVKRLAGKRGDPKKKTLKNLYENDIFGIAGYHDAYKKALDEGKALTPKQSLTSMFKELDGKSMLLIQNINFENKMIAEVLNRSPDSKVNKYAKQFGYVSQDHKGKLLFSPPEVTMARHEAMRAQTLLGKTTDPKARASKVKEINNIYQGLLSSYNKAIDAKKGTVTVELMDISNAMYSMAAERNKIDSAHIGVGLKVDFLKQALFKGSGAEKHTAAADAADQVRIFNKLGEMMHQLSTNSVSESNMNVLARIRAAQPFESSAQFMSGIRNTLEEMQGSSTGETRLIDPESIKYKKKIIDGVEYSSIGPDYYDKSIKRTRSSTKARNHVVERFFGKGTKGVDIEAFSDSLKGLSLEDQIKKAKEGEKFFGDKVSRILNNAQGMDEKFTDALTNMKHKRKIAFGALAIGAFAMTRTGDNEQSYKERTQEKMYARSNDRTFNMYSRPEVYHGTGLYMWENATRHHEY
ncbi:MAG: hypothetical protein DRQ78_05510, partial [Epsilonproteobacteria bacterium]